jgi:Recombination, repair and ssDNA binding protein UvsY
MTKLDDILEEWATDSIIDKLNAGDEAVNTSKLHAKYLKIYVKYSLLLKKAKDNFAEMKKIKYGYYSGQYNSDKDFLTERGWEPFKLILKSDIQLYLDADKDLIDVSDKVSYYEQIIFVCDKIMATFKNRPYEIRSYIDWVKFKNGS